MIPPDRTMFKTGVGRDTGSGQQLSSMEKLIRYAEKDDLLLYITALFGILMPGIMYFIYKKAHNAFLKHAKTRSIQKKKEKKMNKPPEKLQLTIFYGGQGTKSKKLAYEAAEKLEESDPLVVKLSDTDFNGFQFYSGICLFIINIDKELPPECNALFDFLRESKFERKQNGLLKNVTFSVFILTEEKDDVENAMNLVNRFNKEMLDLGGHQLCDNVFCYNEQVQEHFDVWITEVRYTAKRFIGNSLKNRKHTIPEISDSDTDVSYLYSDEDETDHEKHE